MLQEITVEANVGPAGASLWRRLGRRACLLIDAGCLFTTTLGSLLIGKWLFPERFVSQRWICNLAACVSLLFAGIAYAKGLYDGRRTIDRRKALAQTWCIAFISWTATILLLQPEMFPPAAVYLLVFVSGGTILIASSQLTGLTAPAMTGVGNPPFRPAQSVIKRALDLAMGSFLLVLLLPLMIVIAIWIRLDSRGPVLFRQRRIGLHGQMFYIYKFRTMTTLDDGAAVQQACRGDSRVTPVGAFLRRLSLDELPQLFNVLKGDMSLVGPRPHALAHDIQYAKAIALYAARRTARPGITGWAQVNGWRGETPEMGLMLKRVEHDIWYINHWSIWLDIKILLLTLGAAATARNAY